MSNLIPIHVFLDNKDYFTEVNGNVSLAEMLQYWLGAYFVDDDETTMHKCVAVEIRGVKYI